jgi:chromosome segregation ATPase
MFAVAPVGAQQPSPSPQELAAAPAEVEARIRGIEAALRNITAEQQSVYQQFQMAQEMRRSELQATRNATEIYTQPASPPNYDEVVRDKQARESRLQTYTLEMDRLYARYRELADQKRPLLEQLDELTARRR